MTERKSPYIRKTNLPLIRTWVALAVLLISCTLLLAYAWNGSKGAGAPASIILLIWTVASGTGLYLFSQALSHARSRALKAEQENASEKAINKKKENTGKKEREKPSFDFAATARKMVRRTPEGIALEEALSELLRNLARELEIMSGICYIRKGDRFIMTEGYALPPSHSPREFETGEGLNGQVAHSAQIQVLTSFPPDQPPVSSGLGASPPSYLAIVPLVREGRCEAIIECAGFRHNPHEIEQLFRIYIRDVVPRIRFPENNTA